jgi:hypothetical protein
MLCGGLCTTSCGTLPRAQALLTSRMTGHDGSGGAEEPESGLRKKSLSI